MRGEKIKFPITSRYTKVLDNKRLQTDNMSTPKEKAIEALVRAKDVMVLGNASLYPRMDTIGRCTMAIEALRTDPPEEPTCAIDKAAYIVHPKGPTDGDEAFVSMLRDQWIAGAKYIEAARAKDIHGITPNS